MALTATLISDVANQDPSATVAYLLRYKFRLDRSTLSYKNPPRVLSMVFKFREMFDSIGGENINDFILLFW